MVIEISLRRRDSYSWHLEITEAPISYCARAYKIYIYIRTLYKRKENPLVGFLDLENLPWFSVAISLRDEGDIILFSSVPIFHYTLSTVSYYFCRISSWKPFFSFKLLLSKSTCLALASSPEASLYTLNVKHLPMAPSSCVSFSLDMSIGHSLW